MKNENMSGYVHLYKVKNVLLCCGLFENEKEYLTDDMGRKIVFDLRTAEEVKRDMLKLGVVVSFEHVDKDIVEGFSDVFAYCKDMIEEVIK